MLFAHLGSAYNSRSNGLAELFQRVQHQGQRAGTVSEIEQLLQEQQAAEIDCARGRTVS